MWRRKGKIFSLEGFMKKIYKNITDIDNGGLVELDDKLS